MAVSVTWEPGCAVGVTLGADWRGRGQRDVQFALFRVAVNGGVAPRDRDLSRPEHADGRLEHGGLWLCHHKILADTRTVRHGDGVADVQQLLGELEVHARERGDRSAVGGGGRHEFRVCGRGQRQGQEGATER